MSRILTSGFEAPFSPTEEGWEQWDGTANTEALSWVEGGRRYLDAAGYQSGFQNDFERSLGGDHYCLCFDSNDSRTGAFKRNISPPLTEAWGRFAYQANSGTRVPNGRIFEWYLNGIGTICSLVEFDLGSTNVGLLLRNNAGSQIAFNQNALLIIDNARWNLIEWHVVLAGSGGRMEVWVDGVLWIDYTGPLTGPGGETTFDAVIIGQGAPGTGQSFNSNSRRGYDDIAINDTAGTTNNGRVGDGFIFRRVARAPGANTSLLNDQGAADPDVNYARVNRDADPTGFVGAVTPGGKDTYEMTNALSAIDGGGRGMPVAEGYAAALVFQGRGIQNGPSVANIRYSIIPTSQAEVQTPSAPGLALNTAGLLTVNHQVETNPNTGDPFTHSELEGAEAGFSLEA